MNSADYLDIMAEIPDWQRFSYELAVVQVTFQLLTSVADNATRADQAKAHQQRLGDLIDLFSIQNFLDSRAALDAASDLIGVAGWKQLAESKDGTTQQKQLGPVLVYEFTVYRKQADTITNGALQLETETALKTFIAGASVLPDGFVIHPAHAVEKALADQPV